MLVPQRRIPLLDEGDDGLDRLARREPDLLPPLAQLASSDPSSSISGLPDCPSLECECVRVESEAGEGDELRRGGQVTGPECGEDARSMSDRVSRLCSGRRLGIGSGCAQSRGLVRPSVVTMTRLSSRAGRSAPGEQRRRLVCIMVPLQDTGRHSVKAESLRPQHESVYGVEPHQRAD